MFMRYRLCSTCGTFLFFGQHNAAEQQAYISQMVTFTTRQCYVDLPIVIYSRDLLDRTCPERGDVVLFGGGGVPW